MSVFSSLLIVLLAGSLIYCGLVVVAARRYRRVRPVPAAHVPPMSVLKPLAGADLHLEENLRSFFTQHYNHYELLFAVRHASDVAVPVVERLRAEYPAVPVRLLVVGEPVSPNAKVHSLARMWAAARHEIRVMSDSDVRVGPDFLQAMAAEFSDPHLGLVTCPYRAVAGQSFWSHLEAVGMNTEFLGGVLVARLLEGMKFALGPTIAARKDVLTRMGGFETLQDFLAEDFVMGQKAALLGYGVVLSSYVVEHHIGRQDFLTNLRHRLRWSRSTRRSRPAGYLGQVFTHPLPLALLWWLMQPADWPVMLTALLARVGVGVAAASIALRYPLSLREWALLIPQDLLSFCLWIAGFFGNKIQWRGRAYYLFADGRFQLLRQ